MWSDEHPGQQCLRISPSSLQPERAPKQIELTLLILFPSFHGDNLRPCLVSIIPRRTSRMLGRLMKGVGEEVCSLQLQATCQMPTNTDSANPSTALQD